MDYQCEGPLSNNGHALAKLLCHIDGQQPKDTIGLGYGAKDDLPKFSRDAPMTSDLEIDIDESPLATIAQMGDSLPSTSLLWGEESTPGNDATKASTSRGNEQNEFNVRDQQCLNLSQLIEREGITHNSTRASTSRHPKPS